MNSEFWLKLLVCVFFLSIIFSLGTGVYYIIRPSKRTERMVWILTTRMGLSVAIFIIIGISIGAGWLKPKSLFTTPRAPLGLSTPGRTDPTTQNLQNANTKPPLQKKSDAQEKSGP